jgi:hypothetical protein
MSTIRTEKEVQKERVEKLIRDCEKSVLDSIIRPFGLNAAIFNDNTGGNIPTVFNADKGVFPNEAFKKNYEQYGKDYDRTKYDAPWMRGSLYKEINERLDRGETVVSPYTGKPLDKGNIDMDHIIPVKEISKDKWLHLFCSEEDRKKIVNAESNLVPSERDVNHAKSAHNAVKFAESEKGKALGVNPENAKALDDQARIAHEVKKIEIIAEEVFVDAGIASLKLGVRQALGEVLIHTTRASFIEVKDAYKNGVITDLSPSVALALQERGIRVSKAAIRSLKPALDSGVQGAIAGAISEFVTWLINNFMTTAANLVRIIREGFLKLVNAIKLLMFPPKGMSTEDSVREATKIVAGVIGLSLGIAAEEALKAALLQVPMINVAATEIAAVSAGILTGICLAVTAYLIDRFFDEMAMPFETQSLEFLASNNRLQEIFFDRSIRVSEVYRQTSCDFSIILKDLAESKAAISNANNIYSEMLREMEESSKEGPSLLS